MVRVNEALAKTLKNAGYSMTSVRYQVFDLLLEQEPQSIQQLIIRSSGKIDKASLYRTTKLFEKIGIIQKVYIGWKYRIELTDKFSYHHHHLSCLKCGLVIPLNDNQEIENFVSSTIKQHRFKAKRHQFEIYGICEPCQDLFKLPHFAVKNV